jgi:2,4-dienoyl-CoA reductase-like NADH-dependent reductase (Old Yellow Enzyme family)
MGEISWAGKRRTFRLNRISLSGFRILPKSSLASYVIAMTSALFSPFKLGNLNLANRIVVSPMCQYSANDGVASDWHMTHLGMLANSGAVAHAGRKASSQRPWEGGKALASGQDPWPTISPSALPSGLRWHTPRAMTEDDMAHVRERSVDAAKRAIRIGFEAVELHVAHGYLLHSLLSPISNTRNDAWGGSLEGRLRFPLDVVRAVRDAVPRSVLLGARITSTDYIVGGLTPDDAVAIGKALKRAGLDYIDISSGVIKPDSRWPNEPGFNVPIAERVRREVGIPTRVVGMIVNAMRANDIIAAGKADMVALARAFLDDPHWAWHAAQTLGDEVARPSQYLRAGPSLWPGAVLRA